MARPPRLGIDGRRVGYRRRPHRRASPVATWVETPGSDRPGWSGHNYRQLVPGTARRTTQVDPLGPPHRDAPGRPVATRDRTPTRIQPGRAVYSRRLRAIPITS